MAQTPYKTPPGEMLQVSVRLRSDTAAWTYELAASVGATLSATLMQVIEDRRTLFDVGTKVVEVLRADARALGLTTRGYLYFLLREEARELLARKKG